MQQVRAKDKKTERAQFEQDPGKGYPRGYRGFDMGLRQSYMHKVEGSLDHKPEGERNP